MGIRIGIMGYGNLGRSVEYALAKNKDMELSAVFTRRDPSSVNILSENVRVFRSDEAAAMKGLIDVMLVCGGSAADLPEQTPKYAEIFNVVDSFDTHANIPGHFANVDKAAKKSGKIGVISVGWDPGLFSLYRMLGGAVLPGGRDYTFWGKGISQGHSYAIRQIEGVKDARQYTVPVESALEAVRGGENPSLTARQKHTRECFVVAEDGADRERITREIAAMPNYFSDYDTTVHFVSFEELYRDHGGMPHGGYVICTGRTGENDEHAHLIEHKLKLDSNPDFTALVLTAYARAAYRLNAEGHSGCKTIFDIPPSYLSAESADMLIKKYL